MTETAFPIPSGDYERAGLASRALKEQLKLVGADGEIVRRVMIAAYEAEMNAVIHGGGGLMRSSIEEGQVKVEVSDQGPGIADIDLAMTEGYSTAPASARALGFGAGMGLPNIRRSADRFSIESAPGLGTTVRFSIRLAPLGPAGCKPNSLSIQADRCTGCLRCLHVCPTRAMRVRVAGPARLDHLCVDCATCIHACTAGALRLEPGGEFRVAHDGVLVVPPALLGQFPPFTSRQVLAVLRGMGFAAVASTGQAEAALRAAAQEYAAGRPEALGGPVISPVCPAVVNLIETRFPSLIRLVGPFLSPLEIIREQLIGRRAMFVVLCPAQRTAVSAGRGPASSDVVLPSAIESAIHAAISAGNIPAETSLPHRLEEAPSKGDGPEILRIGGMAHVTGVLEQIENGRMNDRCLVEMYACDEGCFGSPLLREDAYVSRRRCISDEKPLAPAACRRPEPLLPRAGLRLDENMARAIQKLSQIDQVLRRLPGTDCGLCGCPTCASMAEDIVLERTSLECRAGRDGIGTCRP